MSDTNTNEKHTCRPHQGVCSNPIYGLGVIGAAFYFLQHANTFTLVVTGIVKAFGWPAVLLYKVLQMLNM